MASSPFDEKAATWDDTDKSDRARVVAEAVVRAVSPRPATRLLEYGAGTGLVSGFLAASVGAITLAEPSAGMREVAQAKIDSGALPEGTRIWDLNLDADAPPRETFDLIVTVMTLHHVENLPTVLSGFATLLADGGRLCIVDLEQEDGTFHDDPHGHVFSGFGEQQLVGALAAAGFTTGYRTGIHDVIKNGRPYPLFLAVCAAAQGGS